MSTRSLIAAVVVAGVFSSVSWSQVMTGPPVIAREPAARSAAMGQKGAAVFWGPFPDFHFNPALLGHHRDLRFERSSSTEHSALSGDVVLRANRLTLGGWGFGITLSGQPISGMGGTYLEWQDVLVPAVGIVHPYEDDNYWGVGVSGFELAENLLGGGLKGEEPAHPISRFADASWGFITHEIDALHENLGYASATTHDQGLLARITPYDSIDHEGLLPQLDRAIAPVTDGVRIDASFGISRINTAGEMLVHIVFLPDSLGGPRGDYELLPRVERQGFALRVAIGLPSSIVAGLEARRASWLASALSPMLALGAAWDRERNVYEWYGGTVVEGPERRHVGLELTILNVLSLRSGEFEVQDDFGGPRYIVNTWGYGVGFEVPGLGGVHYDRAEVMPLSTARTYVEPTSFGFWVNPIGIVRAFQPDQRVQP